MQILSKIYFKTINLFKLIIYICKNYRHIIQLLEKFIILFMFLLII